MPCHTYESKRREKQMKNVLSFLFTNFLCKFFKKRLASKKKKNMNYLKLIQAIENKIRSNQN